MPPDEGVDYCLLAGIPDSLFERVDLSASIALMPLAPLPSARRGQRSDPGSPGQVTDHGSLKRAVKRENHPFPGAARALSGDEAKSAVLKGRQHVLPFVRVQISGHPELALGLGTCLVHRQVDGSDFDTVAFSVGVSHTDPVMTA